MGSIKIDAQTHGGTTAITCETLPIAAGDFSPPGCLGNSRLVNLL